MFGIGMGEIFLIILVVFLISPRSLPEIMRQIGRFFGTIQKYSDEFSSIKKDVKDILDTDEIIKESDLNPFPAHKSVKKKKTAGSIKNSGTMKNKGNMKPPEKFRKE